MNIALQWGLAVLVVLGLISIWRMDAAQRTQKRLQREVSKNVAEHKHAVAQIKQYAADFGQLNQARAASIAKFDDTIDQIRRKFGIGAAE